MLTSNHHPDAEVLSGIAAGDSDVSDAPKVVEHLNTCVSCSTLVAELRVLRASLAELPDLAPSRPLRILPEVAEPKTDGPARWAQRLFGPVLAGGAALAMVGMIGTTAPALSGLSSQAGAAPSAAAAPDAAAEGSDAEFGGGVPVSDNYGEVRTNASGEPDRPDNGAEAPAAGRDVETLSTPAERSPWPMVLFTGVALMVAAALLRWILAPRAP